MHAFGDNTMVTAPEVYWDFCGPHMICMERVSGIPMDQFDVMKRRGVSTGSWCCAAAPRCGPRP